MAHNRFILYNKSLLVNIFMSKEYKHICKNHFIPNYDEVNIQNEYEYTALMRAYYNNNINIIKLLLQHLDINVNIQNKYGNTALIWACGNGYTNMVQLLLQHSNIDINVKNLYGNTALDYAKENDNKNIINLLQSHNAK